MSQGVRSLRFGVNIQGIRSMSCLEAHALVALRSLSC